MKLNNHPFRTAALLLLVMLAAACTKEDDFAASPDEGTANAAPLTITVTDGAYAPTETPDNDNTPATRAVERGYGTEFTKGDRIGLYVVKQDASENRKFLYQNLCLTHDGTGWTLPAGTELTYQPPEGGEILYFAYYPYQDNMEGKVNIDALNPNGQGVEAQRFFIRLIERWMPADDQSTYEAYTASDLMVARGEVAKRTDGTDGSVLSFTMEHQMPLAVFRLPTTKYTYSETIDGKPTEKSYRLYSGLDAKAWLADDNTYRRIMNWYSTSNIGFSYSYYNSSLEKRHFDGTIKADSPGKYFLFTVDGGGETEIERALQVGDFYMSDGTIIPNEHVSTTMPADIQKECVGVVYAVGEEKVGGYKRNDHLLKRDYPNCTHGLVLALQNASDNCAWSNTNELANDWTNAPEMGEEQVDISEPNSFRGYSSTKALLAYNAAYPDKAVLAAETARQYKVASPEGSSGWFMMDINDAAVIKLKALNSIQNALEKAGGAKVEGSYWTSFESSQNTAFCLDMPNQDQLGLWCSKSDQRPVRPVLAF